MATSSRWARAAVDVHRVEALKTRARQLTTNNPGQAAELYREALAAWRGEALADLGDLPVRGRRGAAAGGAAAGPARGADRGRPRARPPRRTSRPSSRGCCAAWPLRERFAAQRMTALYRCGRQAEALRAYQATRTVLAEELGLEPGPRLVELERAIAADDRSLLHEDDAVAVGHGQLPLHRHRGVHPDPRAAPATPTAPPSRTTTASSAPAWSMHRGVEVHTVGDAFFVAFQRRGRRAGRGRRRAARAGRATRGPRARRLRVRMGVHTGEAQPVGRDYVGHRRAPGRPRRQRRPRRPAVATEATMARSPREAGCPPALALTDLGPAPGPRLPRPGAPAPGGGGGPAVPFPPVRTLGFLSSNLPQARTSFIGRVEDRSRWAGCSAAPASSRCWGPAASARPASPSSWAGAVLAGYPDGVFMADLARVPTTTGVARALAEALAVPEQEGRAARRRRSSPRCG